MIQKYSFSFSHNEDLEMERSVRKIHENIVGIFSFETFYIERYIQTYFTHHKKFKDKFKNVEKNKKIIELETVAYKEKNRVVKYDTSRIMSCHTTDKYEDILPLRGTKRADKILEIISTSANEFEKYIPGVKEVFDEAIDSFKQAGYKNIWVHQKKKLKGVGTVKLICELTMFEFTLDLVVEDKEEEIYKKRLITTMPDSLFYHSSFKTLMVSDKEISVTDRIYEKPFFTISVKDILAKKDGKFVMIEKNHEIKTNLGMIPTGKSDFFEAFKKCMKTAEGVPCPQYDK